MAAAVPATLGRYEIIKELGRGAMGVVYLAQDPLIGRRVAIKTFRSIFGEDDPELREFHTRFIREAQSAGILSHPNIVTIHDVVEGSENGLAFIAMEYVEGTNLREILQQGAPLGLEEVVRIVEQVASALDYAHSKGVIHRDVKPANIIIDREGRVKITDFGIARLEASDLTQDGQLLGTPNYMAPERIQGRGVDHRTDIFSLGVVFYEMLTRRKPFPGDNLTMVSHRIVYEPFTPPRDFVPDLPEAVVAVLSRAMAKDPEDRFDTAGRLTMELRRTMEAPGFELRAPPVAEVSTGSGEVQGADTQDISGLVATQMTASQEVPGRRPRRRRAALWAASGALLMLVLAATSAAFWLRRPEAAPPTEQEAKEERHSEVQPIALAARGELAAGRLEAAAEYFLRAVELAPGDPELVDLQRQIVRQLEEHQLQEHWELQLDELRSAARDEASAGRPGEALRLAEQLLALEPEDADALALRDAALDALERQRAQARAERGRRLEGQVPAAQEMTPAEVEPAPLAAAVGDVGEEGEATIVVSFFTEIPKGVLTLYAGRRQVLQESFSFYERSRLLRNQPRAGRIDARLQLEAGTTAFRIYVSHGGQPARMAEAKGRLGAGMEATLQIHLAADGTLDARLE